jgi:hypothetical protein
MSHPENSQSFRMGVVSGYLVAILSALYAAILFVGLITLPTPEHPIQNPWFTIMELLILVIAPAMVAFTVALHSWVPQEKKSAAVLSIVFMSLCTAITSSVHFCVLTLSRNPLVSTMDWAPFVFGFTWPSLSYAMDILAWDIFFALAAFFCALSLRGNANARHEHWLLISASATSFLGLAGVVLENMNIRNIGIVGYVLLFPSSAVLIANRLWSLAGRPNHSLQGRQL